MATCWADRLTRAERAALARRIASAERFFGAGAMVVRRQGRDDEASALDATSAEMLDLHADITERAWTPQDVDWEEASRPCARCLGHAPDDDCTCILACGTPGCQGWDERP